MWSDRSKVHLNVVRYFKSAPGQGILMAHNSAAQLTAFYDSRKATSDYCIILGKSTKTRKQQVVAKSSAEAE